MPEETLPSTVTSEEPAGEPVPLYLVPRAAVPPALSLDLDLDLAADDFRQPRTAAR